MAIPLKMIISLLRDPEVSNKVILQFAFRQVKAIGYLKVLSMLLGALVVALLSVVKIPQIKKILGPPKAEQRAQLALGLAENSVRLETLAQFVHVTFNQQQRNSFINYGESLFVGLQNVAILFIIEYYKLRKAVSASASNLSEKQQIKKTLELVIKPAAVIIGVLVLINKVLPALVILTLQVINIPIGIAAKIPQIQRNAALKSTAHLSRVTIGANVAGSLIRVFTTLQNFKRGRSRDIVLLAGYLTSFVLNAIIAAQIRMYGDKVDKLD